MKAQASLEMVVGLIILLVVAGVVIGLVLHFLNKDNIKTPDLSIKEFLSACESYCNDVNSIEYCKYYYSSDDWDKNGIKNEMTSVGTYEWPTCENRVYCFLVSPCERLGSGMKTIENCKNILCQTYLEKYDGNVQYANEDLFDTIDIGSICDVSTIEEKENWYQVFDDGC